MRTLQAKAVDSLAAFFEACAQMELADFKDHVKALQVWTAASGSMWQPVGLVLRCSMLSACGSSMGEWRQPVGRADSCSMLPACGSSMGRWQQPRRTWCCCVLLCR